MTAIISALLPLLLSVLMGWVQKSKLSKEKKLAFFEWVKGAAKDLKSAKLEAKAIKQMDELKGKPFVESQ